MNTNFKSNKLNNGLSVKILKNSHLHSVCIGIYVRKMKEPICGIAHLVEHLFFRRLADIQQNDLYFEIDRIGATLNAVTYADFICFNIVVSPNKVKEAFNLISKIFYKFRWNADEVLLEKEVVKRQIDEHYDSIYSKADLDYYKGTPKGNLLMGKLSDVNKMSVKKINGYKEEMFVPHNACFVLTGNFSDDDLSYCMDNLINLEDIDGNQIVPSFSQVNGFLNRKENSDKIYPSSYDFSDVCISFDIDERRVNRYSAEILFGILGSGVTSKLSQCLREEKGLVSGISGGIEFSDYAGRMTFEYEVKNKNLTESILSAFDILMQAKGNLNEANLESNIMFYTDNQYRLLDDVKELNFLIGWRGFIESEQIKSIGDLVSRYKSITIQDIRHSAKEVFVPHNLIISVSNNNKVFSKVELNKILQECRKKLEVKNEVLSYRHGCCIKRRYMAINDICQTAERKTER